MSNLCSYTSITNACTKQLSTCTSDMDRSCEESDDEEWMHMEKVIEERKSDHEPVINSSQKSVEEVLNIDDFFGIVKRSAVDSDSNSFKLQSAIENSLQDMKRVPHSPTTSSSFKRIDDESFDDNQLTTPSKFSAPSSSSSRSLSKHIEKVVMKYHRSSDHFNLINRFSDEMLVRMLSLADYTSQRVCRRWTVVQVQVSRLKIVDTLITVSLLEPETASRIENELFLLYSEKLSKQFRQRARSLIFNLRGNEDLRRRVSEGSLLASHLVRMESSETATKGLVQQREAWMAESIVASREIRIVEALRPISTFGCPVCSHNRCEIFHRRKGIIVDGITTSLKCMKCGSFTDQ